MLDVRGGQRGPGTPARSLCVHVEPELRRPARPRGADPPGQPNHSGGVGRDRNAGGREVLVSHEPLQTLVGTAAPFLRPNVDTDVIIRVDRMVSMDPADLAPFAFEALRFNAGGEETRVASSTKNRSGALRSCWPGRTSAAVRYANRRSGRSREWVCGAWSRRASGTSSRPTAIRTGCCPSPCPRTRWTNWPP